MPQPTFIILNKMKSFILALFVSLVTANLLRIPNPPTALKRRGVIKEIIKTGGKRLTLEVLKKSATTAFKVFRPAIVKKSYKSFKEVVPSPSFLSKISKAKPILKVVTKVKKLLKGPEEALTWAIYVKTFPKTLRSAVLVELAFSGVLFFGEVMYTVIQDEEGNEKNITIDPMSGLPLASAGATEQLVYSNTSEFYFNGKPRLILDPNTQISYYLNRTSMKYYCLDIQTEKHKYYAEDNTDSCNPASQNSTLESSLGMKIETENSNSSWTLDPESGEYYRIDANGNIILKPYEVINGTDYFMDKESGELYSVDQAGNVKFKPDIVENGVGYILDDASGKYWYQDDKGEIQWKPDLVENGVNYYHDDILDSLIYYDENDVRHMKIELTEGGKVYYKEYSTGLLYYFDANDVAHYKPDLVEGDQEWVKEPGTGRYFNYDINGNKIYRPEGAVQNQANGSSGAATQGSKSA